MTDISDDELVRYLDAFDDWARANPTPDDTVTRIPGFVSAMLACDQCGAPLQRSPSKTNAHNFCSRQCQGKWQSVHYRGSKASGWRGGMQWKRGRCLIFRPDHPHATKQGYVFLHRLILEEVIGRYLDPEEVVHHINGDFTDNHPENLMVMKAGDHVRYHRAQRKPDHCPHGHPYTPENTGISTRRNGHMSICCKACQRIRARERRLQATPETAQ